MANTYLNLIKRFYNRNKSHGFSCAHSVIEYYSIKELLIKYYT